MRLSKWCLLLVVFAMLATIPLLACGDDDDDDDDDAADDDDAGDDDDNDNTTDGSTCSAMCNKMFDCLGALMDEFYGSVDECITACNADLGSDPNLDCMAACDINDSCLVWGLCIGECGEL